MSNFIRLPSGSHVINMDLVQEVIDCVDDPGVVQVRFVGTTDDAISFLLDGADAEMFRAWMRACPLLVNKRSN